MNGRDVTTEAVWTWISAGCNAAEVAAYLGVPGYVAQAWMCRAAHDFADARIAA